MMKLNETEARNLLTERKFLILNYYLAHPNIFVTAKELSDYLDLSVRTIKKEAILIRSFCISFTSFQLETLPNKGTRALINDSVQFGKDLLSIRRMIIHGSENVEARTMSALRIILESPSYTSKQKLLDKLYISESTLYQTLNAIKQILSGYNLKLVNRTNLGYRIGGNEVNKRMCIIQLKILESSSESPLISNELGDIYNTVADTFLRNHYQTNELTMQNITAHISLTIRRVKNGHTLEQPIDNDLLNTVTYQISKEILNKLLAPYNLKEKSLENEINLLSQTISGKLDYSGDDKLQTEINEFLSASFQLIKNKFFVNFEPIENLKLLLALHLIPLFYRIRSGTQLNNIMTAEIQQSFPLAHDIALYFSILVNQRFNLQISQDEVPYLSLYFNFGLENLNISDSSKKIIILTSLRKSETVLLKHKILTWFPNQISEIMFTAPNDEQIKFEDYDAIFSTDKNNKDFQGGVTIINIFPDEKDFEKINLAINGYTTKSAILDKFSPECFFVGDVKSKAEILEILCENATVKYKLPDNLYDVINERESISNTYFGNGIAIPHPLSPFSEDTFVSIGLLKNPISWDRIHSVRVVMLVSIEKNNPRTFQFWHYISTFVKNENLFSLLFSEPTFENFMAILEASLDDFF